MAHICFLVRRDFGKLPLSCCCNKAKSCFFAVRFKSIYPLPLFASDVVGQYNKLEEIILISIILRAQLSFTVCELTSGDFKEHFGF